MNTHIQSLKVWLKSVLPWLKYIIFFQGIVFLLAHPVDATLCRPISYASSSIKHGIERYDWSSGVLWRRFTASNLFMQIYRRRYAVISDPSFAPTSSLLNYLFSTSRYSLVIIISLLYIGTCYSPICENYQWCFTLPILANADREKCYG